MPGTLIFKPIEAKITHSTVVLERMNPYCSFKIGNDQIKGQICKNGGKNPHWSDSITVPILDETTATVDVLDKDRSSNDGLIGSFLIDLKEVESKGELSKWYSLSYKNEPAGEILMEATFKPKSSLASEKETVQTEKISVTEGAVIEKGETVTITTKSTTVQPALIKKEEIVTTTSTTQPLIAKEEVTLNQVSGLQTENKVFTEQRQVIEPHTFIKEVESVEITPVWKEVEVMEPRKVIKNVEVTEPVVVTKQVEVIEPQVVKKMVEVMEPRVVIKEIKVIENVPVMKEVEVIEPVTVIKEIKTTELQTVKKMVEVIENFPVKKMVEVTEPVTITKEVEYVEPVITTTTIVKEVQQPVVVEEKVTTSVGPVSVIGTEVQVTEQKVVEKLDDAKLVKQETIVEKEHSKKYENLCKQLFDSK